MLPIDAGNARDVLAVVLCPARAFAGSDEEGAEAAAALLPVKAALIRRFRARTRKATRN
jgi:hypothetical protein